MKGHVQYVGHIVHALKNSQEAILTRSGAARMKGARWKGDVQYVGNLHMSLRNPYTRG